MGRNAYEVLIMKTETLSDEKLDLIVRISKLDDKESVRKVKDAVDVVEKRPTKEQLEMLEKLAKPMKKTIDIEELKREQNWKPTTQEEIDALIEDFDWQIPEDEFLELLKNI